MSANIRRIIDAATHQPGQFRPEQVSPQRTATLRASIGEHMLAQQMDRQDSQREGDS